MIRLFLFILVSVLSSPSLATEGALRANGGFFGASRGGLATGGTVQSDYSLCLGTSCNYWLKYNSSGLELELWSSDIDGGGTDGKLLIAVNGANDLRLMANQKLVFDSDYDSNNYITCSDSLCRVYSEGGNPLSWGSAYVDWADNALARFGNGWDNWIVWAESTKQWRFIATDVSGTGTDGDVMRHDQGEPQMTFPGGIRNEKDAYVAVKKITVDDSPYTVVAGDSFIIVDTDAGTGAPAAVTVNLPAAACSPGSGSCRRLNIKNIGGTANVTVDANGAEEIDDALTQTLTPGDSLTIVDTNQTDYHWSIE